MSDQYLKLRRSSVPGKIPTTSAIDFGEIALNTYDGLAFIKKSDGVTETVVPIGITSGSFTGSFFGTASYSQTASYLLPLRQNVILTGSLFVTQSYISRVDWIDFTIDPGNPAHSEGRIHWLADRKTLQVDTEVNNFMIPLGHMNVLRGKNAQTYALTPGMVVYIDGNSGQFATFGTASWEDETSSAYTIGMIAQTINPNNSGYAVTLGEITGINTNAYAPGTLIYLSSSGQFTSTKPIAPLNAVRLGQVVVQATDGKLQIKVDNGYETDELHDVLLTNAKTGDLFVRSGSVWINTTQLTGSYGLTGSLSISGAGIIGTSSYALTASYALNAASANSFPYTGSAIISGSLTIIQSGSIGLNVNGNITGSNALFTGTITAQTLVVQTITSSIDYVTGSTRFGSSSANTHQFTGSVSITGSLNVIGPATINNLTGSLFGTSSWSQYALTASYVTSTAIVGDVSRIATGSVTASVGIGTASFQITSGSSTILFVSNSNTIGINTTGSSAYSLDVNGLVRVSGSILGGIFTPGSGLNLNSFDAFATTGKIKAGGGISFRSPINADDTFVGLTGTGDNTVNVFVSNGNVAQFSGYGASSATIFNISNNFNPSSLSFDKNNFSITTTINTSGTYSGGVRGFYYNPTLTSLTGVTFHRAIETVTGDVILGSTSGNVGIGPGKTVPTSRLDISGSVLITGSLNVSQGITGSLFGTASWAQNVSTASYVTGSNVYGPFGSNSVLTSSYALTASYVIGGASTIAVQDEGVAQGSAGTFNFTGAGVSAAVAGGIATINIAGVGGTTFPYTGSAIISGSLIVIQTGSVGLVVTGSITSTGGFTGSLFGTASYVTGSIFSGTNPALSSSYALTASYALNAGASVSDFPYTGSATISGSLSILQSGSFGLAVTGAVVFSGSTGVELRVLGDQHVTGSLFVSSSIILTPSGSISVVSGSIRALSFTGSLLGTASYATGSIFNSSNPVLSASYALSSSYSATASSADDFLVRNNITASNALFTGTITAQTLVVQTVTSSVAFISGSTRFGSSSANTHEFTGSVKVTGSFNVIGPATINNLTGSLFGTSSWSQNALTASYVTGSNVYGPYGSNSILTSSYAITASYALNGGGASTPTFPYTGSAIISGSLIVTGSVSSAFGFTGSLLGTSSYVTSSNVYGPFGSNSVLSASLAQTASYAVSASYVIGGASTITIQDEGITQGSGGTLNFTGPAVTATVAGGIATINIQAVSGSVAKITQSSPSTLWSFAHNLGERYPVVSVYDSAGDALIPGRIETIDSNNLNIYFSVGQTGTAVAMVGGTAVTASYANTMVITSTELSTQQNTDIDTGTEVVAIVNTGSYTAAFFDYYANDGTNYRAGTVMSTWNTVGSVRYTDNSTLDIGNTSGVTLSVVANGSNVELRATVTTNNWNVKAFARAL